MTTCGRCDSEWTGLKICHCYRCHETFSVARHFDAHRAGTKNRPSGTCYNPAESGLAKNPHGVWVEPTSETLALEPEGVVDDDAA